MPKPELSLSEILEKLENAVAHDIRMRNAHQTQRLPAPKQVHAQALHSLQVKIDAERKEAVEEYQEKARKFVEDVEKSEGL